VEQYESIRRDAREKGLSIGAVLHDAGGGEVERSAWASALPTATSTRGVRWLGWGHRWVMVTSSCRMTVRTTRMVLGTPFLLTWGTADGVRVRRQCRNRVGMSEGVLHPDDVLPVGDRLISGKGDHGK